MRRPPLVMLALALMNGACGDDGSGELDVAAVIEEWVTVYDRQIAATCPCLVPLAFPTSEECMTALGSGPSWVQCATEVAQDTDARVEDARCLIDELDARATCLEQAGCDAEAMAACLDMPMTCPALDNDLVVRVLEQCPDTGLLSR